MQEINYRVSIFLGAVCIRLLSELPLSVTDELRVFCSKQEKANEKIYIKIMKDAMEIPSNKIGEDLLLEYYYDQGYFYAAAKRGTKASVTVAVYSADFSEMVIYINEKQFPGVIRRVSKILQLFPVRKLLTKHHGMILHSSRILFGSATIIFTAPSQTGKTTQARLWEKYEKAEIVSNDRTLIQKENEAFFSYGYPVDGGSPVYDNRKLPLAAIVVLRQGNENRTECLPVGKALKYLMEQTVADQWDIDELAQLRLLWLEIIEKHPVYQLTCTPDERAVRCIKERLKKDGVIAVDGN